MIGIYKIENKLNGKVYIGQSIHIKQRWQEHKREALNDNSTSLLYKAIRKYGLQNFSFEVIEECEKEQLNEREVYWIKNYNSFNRDFGYNLTPGGNEPVKVNPQLIYDLWDKGYSVMQICKELKSLCCEATIKKYLHEYKNWNLEESIKRRDQINSIKARERYGYETIKIEAEYKNKVIKQYDLFGNFIKNWNHKNEVLKELNIPKKSLDQVLKGELLQTHGFQWHFGEKEDRKSIENIIDKVPLHFEIIQKDLSGNIIARYKTIKEAAQTVGCCQSNISKVCKHLYNRKTAKGFIWEYDFSTWYDID